MKRIIYRKIQAKIRKMTLIGAASVIAFILSVVIDTNFWWSLGNDGFSKVLYALTGNTLGIIKLAALTTVVATPFKSNITMYICSVAILLVLSLVSILASISVLSSNIEQNHQSKLSQSENFKAITTQVAGKEQSILLMQQSVAKDIDNGFRQRANIMLAEITKEQSLLNELQEQKHQLSQEQQDQLLGALPKSILMLITVVLGAVLEISTAYLFFLKTGSGRIQPEPNSLDDERCLSSKSQHPVTTTNNCGATSKEQQQYANIIPFSAKNRSSAIIKASSKNGSQDQFILSKLTTKIVENNLVPTTRAIKKEYKIGSEKACELLRILCQRNVIVKKQKGYGVV